LEGEAWIGIAFAKEYRLMLSFIIGAQEASLAQALIASTEERLRADSWPVWVSDGLDAYGEALKGRHCFIRYYHRTGKRGRPRRPKLVACPELRYAQVVKQRDERHRVIAVTKRIRYGDVPLEKISTVYIERHNLTLRHDNRRLTRKTIAFSKKVTELKAQMSLYQGYYNFSRCHRALRLPLCCTDGTSNTSKKWQYRTPAMAAGLSDHIWSLRQLMSMKTFINY
jgi:IS1 family transposase